MARGKESFQRLLGQVLSLTPFSLSGHERKVDNKTRQVTMLRAFCNDMLGSEQINLFDRLSITTDAEKNYFVGRFMVNLSGAMRESLQINPRSKETPQEKHLIFRLNNILPYFYTIRGTLSPRQADAISHTARRVALNIMEDYRQRELMQQFAKETNTVLDTKNAQFVAFDAEAFPLSQTAIKAIAWACEIYQRDMAQETSQPSK